MFPRRHRATPARGRGRRRPTREDAERILTLPIDHPAYETTINLGKPCPLATATGEDRAEQPRRRGHRKPTLRLLDWLAQHAPTVAAAVCRQLHGRDGDVATRASQLLCRLDPSAMLRAWLAAEPGEHELIRLVPLVDADRLDLAEIGQLSGLLLDRFPIATSPHPGRVRHRNLMFEARSARDMIRKRLVTVGGAEELEQLMSGRADADLAVLRREVRLARARAANQALVPLSADELLAQLNETEEG